MADERNEYRKLWGHNPPISLTPSTPAPAATPTTTLATRLRELMAEEIERLLTWAGPQPNLREATESQQPGNYAISSKNTSGVRGVTWDHRYRCWRAKITIGHRTKHLGQFKTKEEAGAAYEKAARERWGEFYSTEGHAHEQ